MNLKSLALAAFGLLAAGMAMAGPEIDFAERPSYLPNNVLNLTFDDGPDFFNTAKVLDVLKAKNAKASFFINRENWANIDNDENMRNLVRRIVAEGHILANHTARHFHLSTLSDWDVEQEIASVENSVNSIFAGKGPKMTLLRAPFGDPFQDQNGTYPRISKIFARHGVHVGWSIDSGDFDCAPGDANCVYNNLISQIKTPGQGRYGVILMHSVHDQTVGALGRLIDYIRARGFVLWSTEDVVKARFGKTSAELMGLSTPPSTPTNPTTPTVPTTSSPIVDGAVYSLISRHSGRCLDVKDRSLADGATLQQWDCNEQPHKKFKLVNGTRGTWFLVAQNSQKCVSVEGSKLENGTTIHQWTCASAANQRITLTPSTNGSYVVKFAHSGKCLDVSGPSVANGAKVHQWECHKGANQDWILRR